MANYVELPDIDLLRELFRYDPETGFLHWNKRRCGTVFGKKAGSPDKKGYLKIKINDRLYLAHRVIWALHHGTDPLEHEVDHKDRNPSNNRIENLRLSMHGQNQANGKAYRNNKTGYRGVHFHKQHRKYAACINVDKRSMHLGLFATPEAAAQAYDRAALKYFGEFAQINGVAL